MFRYIKLDTLEGNVTGNVTGNVSERLLLQVAYSLILQVLVL